MGIMWPTSQSHFHPLFIFIEMNFYSLSFLCDVCNDQVHEHTIVIIGLQTYVLNIPIHEIFEKDIELSGKNNTI